jgi:hypothetical protein
MADTLGLGPSLGKTGCRFEACVGYQIGDLMNNKRIFKDRFTTADIAEMDPRIQKALLGWKVTEIYKGYPVEIPGTWNAEIYPYKYFEIYKKDTDPNPGEEENEIQCYISCGWRGNDDEALIILLLLGEAVLDPTAPVVAELYNCGAAYKNIFRHGKIVTNFEEKFLWFFKRKINKVVITIGA